jgi:hypothetical protein
MHYRHFLTEVHQRLQPRAYLEIGLRNGNSFALARCRAVGIDPAYAITAELDGDFALFRTTSDEYFSRPDPLAPTGNVPFDLCFIDGLHLFEFALRDFIFAERHAAARGVIIFDDVLPRTVDEAARQRHTTQWTGDVFWVFEVLRRYRPDLIMVELNTRPTGLLAVFGLDPSSTVLADNFTDILAEFRRPDPQPVPAEVLDRLDVVPAKRFLSAGVLELLAAADPGSSAADLGPELRELTAQRLGAGFVASLV